MKSGGENRKIYSEELGINLKSGRESEIFKWFLACLLFGKPIQQEVAKQTYLEFRKARLLTPEKIKSAGWDKLVEILDKGHYVRFDYSTADKLLDISNELTNKYDGRISNLIKQAKNSRELNRKLQQLKHVGPTTAGIFLRDLKKNKLI